jgi:hypothetical protein
MTSVRDVVGAAILAALAALLQAGCGAGGFSADFVRPDPALAREIEEADIIKYEGGTFYLANAYTGLRIIDARRMDRPEMLGSLPLGGKTVEMFLHDEFAFVFTTSDLQCAGSPVQFGAAAGKTGTVDYEGSRLWVIDVSDPLDPELVSKIDTAGFVTGTRRVGEVVYLAGNTPAGTQAFISSVNIADPAHAFVVEHIDFDGHALDIHVAQNAMYVLGRESESEETTLVTTVDIADPAGDITVRDQFRVPGLIQNRFFADEYEGTFRIVTEEFDDTTFVTRVALYTYDVSRPDDITRLAGLPIVTNESLRAVRFDAQRGYAVTFLQVDPLFVLDLSDPASPRVAGELEVPGWSTHLVAFGDRLVGVGFDDSGSVKPAVALYDVADAARPRRLDRIVLGRFDRYGVTSEATVDEKALKVLPDAGMILLPFSVFDAQTGEYSDFLQIVGLEPGGLSERAAVEHPGLVRRADVLEDRVWILSDAAFQTLDASDLDKPASLGMVHIIDDQTLLDAGLADCVDSARTRGTPVGAFFTDTFPPQSLLLGTLLILLLAL